ncbi:uncharacterized protein [Dysidea avara]|uniref:uncharacterized protein n=1 Tax=Dysidea avara TaxID=196820 RepID=UPI00332F98F3
MSAYKCNYKGGPPAPVNSLDVSELCVNGFIVSWDPVTIFSESVCGTVSYDVTISPPDETIMMGINETSYSVTKSPYQFGRLTNSANLNVTVIGTNLGGSGVPRTTEVKIPELSQAVPSSVRNLTNTNTTKDAIAVQWGAANASFCGDVLKYYVTISYDNGTLVDGGSTEQTNYTFDDLMDNTYYVIVALANNAAGNGTATTIVVKTPGPQDDNDDDSAAAIVGGVVATFFITLVVTTLINIIITRMYYKYWYDLKKKPNNNNSESVQHDIIKMDTNPAYATATKATDTIKIDSNPAYTVAK